MICEIYTYCIGSFVISLQVHHGQSCAVFLVNALYIKHPKQIPKADSKKRKIIHTTQIKRLMGLTRFKTTNKININKAKNNPIPRANLF